MSQSFCLFEEMNELSPTVNICKSCGHQFAGKYCNHCGEKVYSHHDKSVVHLLEEGVHFITHFEGSLLTTVKTILTRPGKLSTDYITGIRKRYFKPMSFFLLLVVLYLLFPLFEGLNMKAHYYANNQVFGNYAAAKMNQFLGANHLTMVEFEELFHQKTEKVSKFLLIIIIPLTALFLWPVTYKKRSYYFEQFIFSAEISSIFLLWGFLLLPLLVVLFQLVIKALTGSYISIHDWITGLLVSIPLAVFVFIASKRFYGFKNRKAFFFSLYSFAVNSIVVQFIYKFILFSIAMKMVHAPTHASI